MSEQKKRISGQSERLKDDGRLDMSITVCYQLKVTIGVYQMVEASEIQSRIETVDTMVLAEMHHFQHERVTDFKKMFQDMLTTQISFYSNIVSKLQDTLVLDKIMVGVPWGSQ